MRGILGAKTLLEVLGKNKLDTLRFGYALGLEKKFFNPNRAVFATDSKGMRNNC